MISFIGRFFFGIDIIIHNFKIFIEKHEKTFEIFFLATYVFLQLILINCFPQKKVTIIVLFLLFLI